MKSFDFNKYIPVNISELENDYEELNFLIKNEKSFIINGKNSIGKLTILKLYLNNLNYDFNIINYDINYDDFITKYKFKSNSVLSYLFNKKYTIIIKDFEKFDEKIKELIIKNKYNIFFIIITTSYLNNNLKYIHIKPPSFDYLSLIYLNIFFIETNEYDIEIPYLENFFDIKNYLSFNINNKNNLLKFDKDLFNSININKIINETNFQDKLNLCSRLESINIINHNIIYNYFDIDDIVYSYEFILDSYNFYNFYNEHFYEIFQSLNIIGSLNNFHKNNNFKIIKSFSQYKKKKILSYY